MFLERNIKHLRKSSKMTQKEFAESIELKSATIIGKYEEGKVIPPVEVLKKIAEYFKVDLQSLMFQNLETGEIIEKTEITTRVGNQERMVRLLERELERLEGLENKIKSNPRIMEQIRKIDPDLAKSINDD